ncbi:MAG: SAM-dependent chlorinase/fluorinase [Thermodesulfobacteriota bacterium]
MRRIITLSSDFGLSDHYVGVMKGVILSINPEAQVVDISHEVPKYDVLRGALLIQNSFAYFPKDTIHVVVVDPGVGTKRKPIIIESDLGTFVGPDNGVFTFILEKQCNIYEITNKDYMLQDISSTFHGRDIFSPAAAHLSSGVSSDKFGDKVENPILLELPKPQLKENEIIGEILYEDSFGNLISNIPASIMPDSCRILVGDTIIDTVVQSYQHGEIGEPLAIIGSSGYLEISVNQGNAANLIKEHKINVILKP